MGPVSALRERWATLITPKQRLVARGLCERPVPRSAANLGEWLNEPYITDPVIGFLRSAQMPVLMRDVATACGVSVNSANRVLLRLHASGRANRYKLPIQRHAYCHKRKAVIPYAATRMLFVYTWARPKTN